MNLYILLSSLFLPATCPSPIHAIRFRQRACPSFVITRDPCCASPTVSYIIHFLNFSPHVPNTLSRQHRPSYYLPSFTPCSTCSPYPCYLRPTVFPLHRVHPFTFDPPHSLPSSPTHPPHLYYPLPTFPCSHVAIILSAVAFPTSHPASLYIPPPPSSHPIPPGYWRCNSSIRRIRASSASATASVDSRPSSEPLRAAGIAGQQRGGGFGRSSFCAQQARLDERPF